MKRYQTSIEISANTERVWHVLTHDLPRDPAPFGILRIEGALALGERLKLWSEVAPKRAFALTVRRFDAPDTMVWQGGNPLFTGTRTFQLSSIGQTTRFEMTEVFSGALSGLIARTIPDLTPSFENLP